MARASRSRRSAAGDDRLPAIGRSSDSTPTTWSRDALRCTTRPRILRSDVDGRSGRCFRRLGRADDRARPRCSTRAGGSLGALSDLHQMPDVGERRCDVTDVAAGRLRLRAGRPSARLAELSPVQRDVRPTAASSAMLRSSTRTGRRSASGAAAVKHTSGAAGLAARSAAGEAGGVRGTDDGDGRRTPTAGAGRLPRRKIVPSSPDHRCVSSTAFGPRLPRATLVRPTGLAEDRERDSPRSSLEARDAVGNEPGGGLEPVVVATHSERIGRRSSPQPRLVLVTGGLAAAGVARRSRSPTRCESVGRRRSRETTVTDERPEPATPACSGR